MTRAKLTGLRRNLAVAIGNSGDRAALAALVDSGPDRVSAADEMVQEHVAWALDESEKSRVKKAMNARAQFPSGLLPSGTEVVLRQCATPQSRDQMLLTLDAARRVMPLLETTFDERNGVVSPDGRWLAYESNSSGRFEVFVRPFPRAGSGQWQVSVTGGAQLQWARDGRELFFLGPDGALMSVAVQAGGAAWNAGAPARVFQGQYYTGGDGGRMLNRQDHVSPDGKRFLIKLPAGSTCGTTPSFTVDPRCVLCDRHDLLEQRPASVGVSDGHHLPLAACR